MKENNALRKSKENQSLSPLAKSPSKQTPIRVKPDRIKVFVRFKPLTQRERERVRRQAEWHSPTELILTTHGSDKKKYLFDGVFDESAPNREIYEKGCTELVKGLAGGQSGLIFVYGNTGTGKTYTMGLLEKLTTNSEGIVPHALHQIFNQSTNHTVSLSFCQMYMEEVYDLLSMEEKKLTIRENGQKQPYVDGLIKIRVSNFEQSLKLLNIGLEQRHVAEQKLNRNSSRGHALLTVYVRCNTTQQVARMCFVDLAGSQRIKESESKGINLTEAVHINSSLSALQTLLLNLSTNSLPTYRSNKLTRLLQPYFQNGRISLIVTHNSQNIQPIEFAKRCKGIKFIEKKHEDENKKKPDFSPGKSISRQPTSSSSRDENQKLLYYVNCLVGLLAKINQYIGELIQKTEPIEPVRLQDLLGVKGGKSGQLLQIQERLNRFVSQLDQKQKQMTAMKVDVQQPQSIMNMLDDNKSFINEVQNIGKSILSHTRFLHDISEHRKQMRQELVSTQLKCLLLQKKGKRGEEVIEYLMNKVDKHKLHEVYEKVKLMGIQIDTKPDKPSKTEERSRQKSRQAFIYIDQQHSNL